MFEFCLDKKVNNKKKNKNPIFIPLKFNKNQMEERMKYVLGEKEEDYKSDSIESLKEASDENLLFLLDEENIKSIEF